MTEHAAHQPGLWSLFWPHPVVLNFGLFLVLLVYFLRAPLAEFFRARAARLREALDAGVRAREEAAALHAALARDIAERPAQMARLRADLRAAAEFERTNLLASGKKAAERIRSDARLLAESEFATAREALRAEAIDEAVRQAIALIQRAVRPEDQERFVREFIVSAGATS